MGRYAPEWANNSAGPSRPLQMESINSLRTNSFSSLGDTTPKQSMFNLNKITEPASPRISVRSLPEPSRLATNITGGLASAGLGAAGGYAGGYIGSKLGRLIGGEKGENIGKGIGSTIGGIAGLVGAKALGFKKGGKVKRTGKALVHKGEFILPKGVKPTKKQIKKVRKRGGRV